MTVRYDLGDGDFMMVDDDMARMFDLQKEHGAVLTFMGHAHDKDGVGWVKRYRVNGETVEGRGATSLAATMDALGVVE